MRRFTFAVAATFLLAGSLSAQTVRISTYSSTRGSTVTIPVAVERASTVAGGSVVVSYDKTRVTVSTVTAGDFGGVTAKIDNTNGVVTLCASRADACNLTNATLAKIVFTVSTLANPGTSSALRLSKPRLGNSSGVTMVPGVVHGSLGVK